MPCGVIISEAGGWYTKPIEGPDDLKGLNIRIDDLGGKVLAKLGANAMSLPVGEISTSLETDLADLRAACDASGIEEALVNAASPGVLTKFVPDMHYGDEDAYIADLADAMAIEYEAIVDAGFILQIVAPDVGSARHNQYQDLDDDGFLKIAARNVEAVNTPPATCSLNGCACMSAGTITKAYTPTTCRSPSSIQS